ncbi:MAG TPA: hypothetical protein EYG50_02615 [Cycloclasticus sp.]|jgi:thiosulfate/3-mercaptopyruvate sulfurtransferase|nr:hypothetical protein [Cycloclasticus sp.]HIL91633.1 hypothetical protein [Cycloclasticus sp.]
MIFNPKTRSYIKGLVLLVMFLFAGLATAAEHSNILLSIDEVKARIEQGNVTLVDSRSLVEFKKGHIKGAVSLPTDETFTKTGRSDLVATITEIRDLMSAAGITSESKIIIYGDKTFLDMSRLFWVLETFGVKDVAIMNGFFGEWVKKITRHKKDCKLS